MSREQQRTRLLRSEVEALRKELEIAKGSAAAIRTPRSRTVHSDDEEVDVTDPALFLEPQRGAQPPPSARKHYKSGGSGGGGGGGGGGGRGHVLFSRRRPLCCACATDAGRRHRARYERAPCAGASAPRAPRPPPASTTAPHGLDYEYTPEGHDIFTSAFEESAAKMRELDQQNASLQRQARAFLQQHGSLTGVILSGIKPSTILNADAPLPSPLLRASPSRRALYQAAASALAVT